MRILLNIGFIVFVLSGSRAGAQAGRPMPILPDTFAWRAVSHTPGASAITLLGDGREAGMYVFRVRFAQGTKGAPHTHPDERFTLVVSGILYVGFGESFDESLMVPVRQGSVYVAPAGRAHYLWARDGEVVIQESGVKPTATAFVKASPPPPNE